MKKRLSILGGIILALLFLGLFFFPDGLTSINSKISEDVNEQAKYQRIEGFSDMKEQVVVKDDITYSDESKNLVMDVYLPKKTLGKKKPVLFWAHGGAFIAGDKRSVSDYSVMLASQGYVVVNINYGLAPAYPYPKPLEHVADAYTYMVEHADTYDMDVNRVAFGGDSAGGQIMGQFVNIQTNEDYADMVEIEPVVKKDTIKAVIFFSALLDLNKYDENENENANEVFDKSAQAYFGVENWKQTDEVQAANVVGNLTESFPPTFFTDGNTASFQDQAEQLAEELEDEDVPVTTSFFPEDQAELRHEYQFNMEVDEAVENYEAVSDFLAEYLR